MTGLPSCLLRSFWTTVAIVFVLFGVDAARADGLVAGDELSVLTTLEVSGVLDDGSVRLTETRRYSLPSELETVTYYRSLVGPPGVAIVEAHADGEAVAGVTLTEEQADQVRRALVLALSDPAPLRELGTPMFVAELGPRSGSVELLVTTTSPLAPYGTFRGITLPIDWHKMPLAQMSVSISATTRAPLRALYAPNHDLAIDRESEHSATASFNRSNVYTEFDLVLLLSTGDEPVKLDLLPFRYSDAEGGFYLAKLSARSTQENAVVPREIAFAIDVSGSMAGEKLDQAKAALISVMERLRPEDSFALVAFSDDVRSYRKSAVLADREHVAGAIAFVEQLEAAGGTNIHAALQTSFEAAQAPDRPRYIVLLTDGQPTAGETSIDAIAELGRSQSESGTRLFAFGIGHDVNTLLLDRLARDSSGDALYIQPGADVFSAVTAFFEQIADPVLSAPALDMSGFGSSDPYPVRLQDLYAGLPAVVVGRYDTPGTSSVTLSGQRQGSTIAYSFDVALPRYDVGIGAVPRVWALRRIGSLLEEVKLGASATLENEVLALATRYGIGTAFTSFGLDEQGNTRMTYSPVPTDAVGSTAVGTSSLLDGYTKGATVTEAPAAADVRYFRDRVFPLQDGYYSDSSLIDRSDWVDLTFGSELYFAFAEAEAQFGAAEVLSLAKSVQFELLGRAFRVTGPEHPLAIAGNLPPEASSIPEPIFWPEPGTTVVTETTTTTNPDEAPDPDADSETANPKSADPNLIAGCTCRAARPRPLSIEAWWAMVGIVLVWFRRIDKTNACKRTWRHT